MALASSSSAAHSTTSRDQDTNNAPRADPFWQSTPRTNSPSLATSMSSVQQAPPTGVAAPSAPASAPSSNRYSRLLPNGRRVTCTHMSMSRVYGQAACSLCARIPSMGWLYACQEDQLPGHYDPLPDIDVTPVVLPDDSDYFDAEARQAEYLKMNPSVIKGIRRGDYDVSQVDKLIQQRKKLIQVINEKDRQSDENTALGAQKSTIVPPATPNIIASVGANANASAPLAQGSGNALPMSTAGTPANTPYESAATTPTKQDGQALSKQQKYACHFQVCHSCRPFFHDRTYASFESVLAGNFPLTVDAIKNLSIKDRNIALTIGLRQPPVPLGLATRSKGSNDLAQFTDDNDIDISVDWTSTSGGESDDSSDLLDSAELYPCPGPGQCPVWSRQSGCAYDSGFDDGKRAMNHGYLAAEDAERLTPETSRNNLLPLMSSVDNTPGGASSTASSVSLPTPDRAPLTLMLPTDHNFDIGLQKQLRRTSKGKSIGDTCSARDSKVALQGKDSHSSLGSEVEVEGGVALTEEAVENLSPDIVTEH
ncbi:Hypothetical predicted protein [Lecanosticta acicola]|uniref:Uncharacterized protein n=1 Tax=Lecanosticta acicola TaxID=111012 RepID=A0AAI8YTS6_9PEZI|nr:Hypothetical predicted protein [Lecanosticta acicola]